MMDRYEKEIEKLKHYFEIEKNSLINSYEKKINELKDDVIKKLEKALEEANKKNQEGVNIISYNIK
jgi:hypothetical protein